MMFISVPILLTAGIVMCALVIIVSIEEIRLYRRLEGEIKGLEKSVIELQEFTVDEGCKRRTIKSLLDEHLNYEPSWEGGMWHYPHEELRDGLVNLAEALGYEWVPESQEKTPAHWQKVKKGGK